MSTRASVNARALLLQLAAAARLSARDTTTFCPRRLSFLRAAMPPSSFLKKKWERVFYTFFDINRNKNIDWNDFEMMFEEIKKLRGEDSNEYRIASDSMGMVWKGLLQATKGLDMMAEVPYDVEITLTEWNTIWEKFNTRHMHIWQWEYLKYMFFLLDKKGDKFLDKSEYRDVMKIYGISAADAEKAFKKFAVDPKTKKPVEKIDYGQFVQLWGQYFTSDDKDAPGSYLFGPW